MERPTTEFIVCGTRKRPSFLLIRSTQLNLRIVSAVFRLPEFLAKSLNRQTRGEDGLEPASRAVTGPRRPATFGACQPPSPLNRSIDISLTHHGTGKSAFPLSADHPVVAQARSTFAPGDENVRLRRRPSIKCEKIPL
jgi:hypothetical protein